MDSCIMSLFLLSTKYTLSRESYADKWLQGLIQNLLAGRCSIRIYIPNVFTRPHSFFIQVIIFNSLGIFKYLNVWISMNWNQTPWRGTCSSVFLESSLEDCCRGKVTNHTHSLVKYNQVLPPAEGLLCLTQKLKECEWFKAQVSFKPCSKTRG